MRQIRFHLPVLRSAAFQHQFQSVNDTRLMPSPERKERNLLRDGLLQIAQALVFVYVVLDAIVAPLFRPLLRWLASIRLVQWLEAAFARLPPYLILALLLIPYVGAEPAKIYALYLVGTGHLIAGVVALAAAYLVSLVLVEQVYQAGKSRLRTISWFAAALDWLFDFRDRLINWMKATPAWSAFLRLRALVRETFARWRLRWLDWFSSLRA
jgi:hypothetical protein